MHLTANQILHRGYLTSRLWQQKRAEALAHYGCICGRCGSHGTDVHHKTYERVGGDELLDDLEVLCRPCHDAHHRVERSGPRSRRRKAIRVEALAAYLTPVQRGILQARHKIGWPEVYIAIIQGTPPQIREDALKMLGRSSAYRIAAKTINTAGDSRFQRTHHARLMA